MDRDMLIDIAYGEADRAEFTTGLQAPRSAGADASRSGEGVAAGLLTFVALLAVLALLLVAGWLTDLFLAALPWSLGLYLGAALVIAVAVGLRSRGASAIVAPLDYEPW